MRELLRVDAGDQVDFIVNDRGDVVVRGVSLDVRELRGLLKRKGRAAVTVDEMNAAILQRHRKQR